MINIIIVDDEVLARVGIQSFFENKAEIRIAGVFSLAADALRFLRESDAGVDIVLTDIEMAEMDGLKFIEVVKKEGLARGIIIITCHKDFEYLRRAMRLGADGYILKHEITEEVLMGEIAKLVRKIGPNLRSMGPESPYAALSPQPREEEIYAIGVVKLIDQCDADGNTINSQVEEVMLQHLLEDIVRRYQMGTLFFPYKKDLFIVFAFQPDTERDARQRQIAVYAEELRKNVQQYVSKRMILGVSDEFREIGQVPKYYRQAVAASGLSFYDQVGCVFSSRGGFPQKIPTVDFTEDDFLDDGGTEKFMEKFSGYLSACGRISLEIDPMKQNLIKKVDIFIDQLLHSYCCNRKYLEESPVKLQLLKAILDAENAPSLVKKVELIVEKLHDTLCEHLYEDNFTQVFQYIEKNIDKKLSLSEIAEFNCMSVPSFCKRFKEKTGITLIQYVNQIKVEKVKEQLFRDGLSLEKIAEKTGFSNENYMVRVFKKVTGQTIKDYRRSVMRRK